MIVFFNRIPADGEVIPKSIPLLTTGPAAIMLDEVCFAPFISLTVEKSANLGLGLGKFVLFEISTADFLVILL